MEAEVLPRVCPDMTTILEIEISPFTQTVVTLHNNGMEFVVNRLAQCNCADH